MAFPFLEILLHHSTRIIPRAVMGVTDLQFGLWLYCNACSGRVVLRGILLSHLCRIASWQSNSREFSRCSADLP